MLALIGLNANAAMYIVGQSPFGDWNPAGGVEMTDNGDGTYTYTATINGTVNFVFADGQSSEWSVFNSQYRYGPASGDTEISASTWVNTSKAGDHGAYKFVGSGEQYVFTFDLTDPTQAKFKVEGHVDVVIYDHYTVAGAPAALFGEEWKETLADNDMTVGADGLYTWSKTNVELPAGKISFKVVADYSWNVASWPVNNYEETVSSHGYYDVTITFDATTHVVKCTVTPTQVIDDDEYTVAGKPAALLGEAWNPALTDNNMTLGADGMYTLTKSDVTLYEGQIAYKVVLNHSWDIASYPAENATCDITKNGVYDVVFTFNPNDQSVDCQLTCKQELPDVYVVAGQPAAVFTNLWDETAAANEMTLGDDGLYTLTKSDIQLAQGDSIIFKVVKNHNWNSAWPEEYNSESIIAEDGTYDMVFTFNPETQFVDVQITKQGGETPDPEVDKVYVFGDVNDYSWDPTKGVEMTYDETNKVYTATVTTTLSGDNQLAYIEFTKQLADSVNGWNDIEAYRFGPESEDESWLMTENLLGVSCLLDFETHHSIAIPAGEWTITVDLANGLFSIDGTWPADTVVEPETPNVYIMGNMEGYTWDAINGVEMTYDETNKVYTATVNVVNAYASAVGYIGFTKQLADSTADDVWAAIAPYRFGPVCDEQAVNWLMTEDLLGVNCDLATDGSFKSIAIPAGEWTITVDLENNTFMIDGTWPVVEPETPNVYIMGNMEGYTWDAINGVEMTYDETNKVYTATVNVVNAYASAVGYIGFTKQLADSTADDVWAAIAPYRFGPVCDEQAVNWLMTEDLLGVNCDLATDGSFKSIAIPAGEWTITVDLENNTFMIDGTWPVVEPYTGSLYILGEVNGNGWAPNVGVPMTYNADEVVFTATVTAEATNYDAELDANYSYFNFTKMLADNDSAWADIADQRFGAVAEGSFLVTDEYLGQELSLTPGEISFRVPSGYVYELIVNGYLNTLIINNKGAIPTEEWAMGDVNHDKKVDVADVSMTINRVLGKENTQTFYEAQGDINGDGKIDVSDVSGIINIVLGK